MNVGGCIDGASVKHGRCLIFSGVLPDSVLRSVLFSILKNSLVAGLKGILSVFVDSNKLGGAADSLRGREALLRDLDKSDV